MTNTAASPGTEKRLLYSADVCRRLGITRGTLSRWVAMGVIEAAEKGPGIRGAFRFHPDEVTRIERSHR